MKNVDYYKLNTVKKELELLEQYKNDLDKLQKLNVLKFEEGEELILKIIVTDSLLFKCVTQTIYQENNGKADKNGFERLTIPGAEINKVIMDINEKSIIVNYLHNEIGRLQNEIN